MTGVKEMVTAARAGIENLAPAVVAAELERGDALLVDVREPGETARGVIPKGSTRAARDARVPRRRRVPAHLDGFDPSRHVILYCAAGSRSALAARSLQELGYREVAHLEGGFAAWLDETRPVATPTVT